MSVLDLSVLIVTYNAGPDIETCLELLAASRIGRSHEVILVDNASTDGTPERVAAAFPWVRVIAERTNHGFAGGNAVALSHARGGAILLLNPDAFLRDPEALSGLMAHLDAHPDVGAVGPRLTFPDGAHQVGDAGYEPRPLSTLVHAAGLSGRFGLRGLYLAGRQARGTAALDVDWICGACLLLRRSAIDAIGGLQSPMFLYGEDVDWGCRLRDAGWRVAYRPGIAVVHLQGGSGGTRSARWLDGLATIYRLRNAGRTLSSPTFFSGPLRLGFSLRALAYGLAARLRKQPDLARKAEDMRRFAVQLRSLRP
ncbi:MAG: glycosyltransferase family 2 protein [Parafilimonas terrae]|nr:glycosyltransferase family 2 protein [Parafilimonas terrae]